MDDGPAGSKKETSNAARHRRLFRELVMPQMGFLLDVWSAKIFSILFYGKNPQNPREAIPPLKQFAEERWEIWKGYAFVYVLNDLVKLSQKVGTDLTVF
jgi:hypothetical protein